MGNGTVRYMNYESVLAIVIAYETYRVECDRFLNINIYPTMKSLTYLATLWTDQCTLQLTLE
jgi:hypothetical protein